MQSHREAIGEEKPIEVIVSAVSGILSEDDRARLCLLLQNNSLKIIEDQLRPGLLAILNTEKTGKIYKKATYDRIYNILLLLARYFPLNTLEEEKPLDVMTVDFISDEKRVCVSTGYQYDKDSLVLILNSDKWLEWNTNEEFNPRDLQRVSALLGPLLEQKKQKNEEEIFSQTVWISGSAGIFIAVAILAYSFFGAYLPEIEGADILWPFIFLSTAVIAGIGAGCAGWRCQSAGETPLTIDHLKSLEEKVVEQNKTLDQIALSFVLNEPVKIKREQAKKSSTDVILTIIEDQSPVEQRAANQSSLNFRRLIPDAPPPESTFPLFSSASFDSLSRRASLSSEEKQPQLRS